MTLVALFASTSLAVCVISFSGLILKQERRHARRVDTLLDRLAHAHGRTWTPPPAEDEKPEEPVPDYDFGLERDPELLT